METKLSHGSVGAIDLGIGEGLSERVEVFNELRRDSVSAEEELFLDTDMLIGTITSAWEMLHGTDQGDPDVRERERDGTLTPYGVIQQHHDRFLNGWSELLYSGAHNSTGSTRLRYAKALEHLRLMVGCDIFALKTKLLHITPVTICALVKKAQDEMGSHTFSHRFF